MYALTTAEPLVPPPMTLALAAAAGDLRATQTLLASVRPRVDRVVRAVLGSSHGEVDDVVQQALIGFTKALPSFRGECQPVSFACRIAVRGAVAASRRSRQARARRDDAVELDSIAASPGDAGEGIEAATDRNRSKAVLRELLGRIPAEQAEAIALRFVLGWSLEEVAEATGAPVNTVRSRVRLGKQALRAAIDGDPGVAAALGRDV